MSEKMKIILLGIIILLRTECSVGQSLLNPIGLVNNFTLPQVSLNAREIKDRLTILRRHSIVHVREGIYWAHFEKYSRKFEFSRIVQRLASYENEQVLGLFAYSNQLYAVNEKFYAYSDWRLFHRSAVALERVVQRLPQIDYYEILNEMNSETYFVSDQASKMTYKRLLIVLSQVLRRYAKKVVAGGLLLEGDFESWLEILTSHSAYEAYDVLAIHPYCYPNRLSEAKFNGREISEVLALIRQKWDEHGLKHKPIWITEIGWPHRDSVSDLERSWGWIKTAEYCDRIADLRQVAESLKIGRVYLYAFEDDEWYQAGENTLPFGLINKHAVSKGLNCFN